MPVTGAVKRQLEDAARNYYLTLNRAYVMSDPELAKPLSTPTCLCRGSLKSIETALARGYTIRVAYKILGVSAHDAIGARASVTLSYSIASNTVVDASGKIVETYAPVKDGIKEMSFVNQDHRWLVSNIQTYK